MSELKINREVCVHYNIERLGQVWVFTEYLCMSEVCMNVMEIMNE
jgi:hypothetical protein